MSAIVHPRQVLKVEVRIDLRSGDIGVTQKFLHGAQVAGRFQQVGGKAVTQHMRVYVYRQTGPAGPIVDPGLDAAGADSAAPSAYKQRALLHRRHFRPALEPGLHRLDCLAAYRQYARLAAFAGDPHQALAEIDAAEVQRRHFGQPQAGRIHQLQHRAVPTGHRIGRGNIQKTCYLVQVQGAGQQTGRPGRLYAARGIVRQAALLFQVVEETARPGQAPLHGAGREAAAVGAGRKPAQITGRERRPCRQAAFGAIFPKRGEIAAIGGHGVLRQSPLKADVVQKRIQLPLRLGVHQEASGVRATVTTAESRPRNSVLLPRW